MNKQLTDILHHLRSPYLEIGIMLLSVLLAFCGLVALAVTGPETSGGEMSNVAIIGILLAFFLLATAIAVISVIAGIGGGVIFTPIMLAFTNVDSVVIRGTGLIVAMFSGLISTGIFLHKGLGNYRFCMTMTLSQSIGALLGATLAVRAAETGGASGEGLMRTALGLLLAAIAVYFLLGSKNLEWPLIRRIDKFTALLQLGGSYFEETEGRMRTYQVTRAPLGLALLFLAGLVGGFFGMGGGWAVTPALNLGMAMPLKLAVANSGIIHGIGSCVSIWPYADSGSLIPLFVLPWISGLVIGGFIGSHLLARIKVQIIRHIMIAILAFTAFSLITKGLDQLGWIGEVPAFVQVLVFIFLLAAVLLSILGKRTQKKEAPTATKKLATTMAPAPDLPLSQRVYAGIIHWVTIGVALAALFLPLLILRHPLQNILAPDLIFGAIFSGANTTQIWQLSAAGSFPGIHAYLSFPAFADSWAQLVLNLGCAAGLLAALPAASIQLLKEQDWLDGVLSLIMAALVAGAMTGII